MSRKRLLEEARHLNIKGVSKLKTNELRDLIREKNMKSTQSFDTPVCQECIKKKQHANLLVITKTLAHCQHAFTIEDNGINVCIKCGLTFGPIVEYTRHWNR